MDYDKLEQELYDYMKSALAQSRFQVQQPQARAYIQEIAIGLAAVKTIKEISILDKQIDSMTPPKE